MVNIETIIFILYAVKTISDDKSFLFGHLFLFLGRKTDSRCLRKKGFLANYILILFILISAIFIWGGELANHTIF